MPARRLDLLSVVVPCHDEEEVLPSLHEEVTGTLEKAAIPFELLLVDDGSEDGTLRVIESLAVRDERVRGIVLSRNFGQQAALSAGLDHARGDAVALLDADLQDPPDLLPEMADRWRRGADVVYGVRSERKGSLLKRLGYFVFYRLMKWATQTPVPLDAGDFGLLDRKVVEAVRSMPERHRFLRGLRSWVGFRQERIEFERPDRSEGRPAYTWKGLIALALDGLFGFSYKPIHLATASGLLLAAGAVGVALWAVVARLTHGYVPQGWASTVVMVAFLGGIQLFTLGIIGEYIRRIYDEVRGRPLYVVDRRIGKR